MSEGERGGGLQPVVGELVAKAARDAFDEVGATFLFGGRSCLGK